MIIFSGWFVNNVLNWCEIERGGLCLGGQSEVRLLHSVQLISISYIRAILYINVMK